MKTEEPQAEERVVPTPICLTPTMIANADAQAKKEGLLRGRSAIVRKALANYLRDCGAGEAAQEAV